MCVVCMCSVYVCIFMLYIGSLTQKHTIYTLDIQTLHIPYHIYVYIHILCAYTLETDYVHTALSLFFSLFLTHIYIHTHIHTTNTLTTYHTHFQHLTHPYHMSYRILTLQLSHPKDKCNMELSSPRHSISLSCLLRVQAETCHFLSLLALTR